VPPRKRRRRAWPHLADINARGSPNGAVTRPHSGFTFRLVIIGDETASPLIATKNGVALN